MKKMNDPYFKKIKTIDGDEVDAFGNWRKYYHWKSGQIKKIKRKYNKRVRRKVKESLRDVI